MAIKKINLWALNHFTTLLFVYSEKRFVYRTSYFKQDQRICWCICFSVVACSSYKNPPCENRKPIQSSRSTSVDCVLDQRFLTYEIHVCYIQRSLNTDLIWLKLYASSHSCFYYTSYRKTIILSPVFATQSLAWMRIWGRWKQEASPAKTFTSNVCIASFPPHIIMYLVHFYFHGLLAHINYCLCMSNKNKKVDFNTQQMENTVVITVCCWCKIKKIAVFLPIWSSFISNHVKHILYTF